MFLSSVLHIFLEITLPSTLISEQGASRVAGPMARLDCAIAHKIDEEAKRWGGGT